MQEFLSYRPPPASAPRRRPNTATGNSSPTASSIHGIYHPSTIVVPPPSRYHYEKKNASNLTTTTSMHLTEPRRNLTLKNTVHAIATIGRTHKPNFSLPSFIGGAPMNINRRDPSPQLTSGASARCGSDLNQGPSQEHPESGLQKKLEALEPINKLGRLRKSSSSMSLKLKLKIPRFKGPKQQKNKDSDGQSITSLTSNSPLSSNETPRLGRMALQSNWSVLSTPPGSKEESPKATNLPSCSATSIPPRSEKESGFPTPSTITDTNSVLNRRQNVEDRPVLSHDNISSSVIHTSEYPRSRTRPTKTQDDISLNVYSAIDKYKSWKLSRRASLSAITNLMSFSESPRLSNIRANSSSLRLDQGANRHSDDMEFPLQADPGYWESKSKGPTPSSSAILKYLTEDLLTPTALIYTDMTFPSSDGTPLHHSQPPIRESVSTSASRAPSSDSRVSTPETTSVSSLYTTSSISLRPKKNKPTLAQLAQWREDEEIICADLDDEFDGEVCLMRFEPRQGWLGFWNKENVIDVIDDLRELRSPRP